MCCLLLVCAVLKTLHSVRHILNEEECRSVGKARVWWDDDLAFVIATKPPGAIQVALDVLEEYKRDGWYERAAKGIKSKLCSTCQLVQTHFKAINRILHEICLIQNHPKTGMALNCGRASY